MSTRSAAMILAGVIVLTGCGGSGNSDSKPTSTNGPATTPVTTEPASTATLTDTPANYETAVTNRLGTEFDDPDLARVVVGKLGSSWLDKLHEVVPIGKVADTPYLSYSPETVPAGDVDALIVFEFGNRQADDGTVTGGPTNEALAAVTEAFVAEHPVPIFAQTTIAEVLVAHGVDNVTSIDNDVDADGKTVYLSTAGVAEKVAGIAAERGIDLDRFGVIAFSDHAVRCILTVEQAGITAAVPEGVRLPADYDPDSGQPWTRDRESYLVTDLSSRLALVS